MCLCALAKYYIDPPVQSCHFPACLTESCFTQHQKATYCDDFCKMTVPSLHLRGLAQLLGAPPGEKINYIDPDSRGQSIVISSILLTSFACLFVITRVFIKKFVTKRLGWDDFFCVAALCFSITRTVLSVMRMHILYIIS